jgi:hypothetical protein
MPFPFAPILLGSHLLVATSAVIPSVDVRKTCQAAASVMTDLMTGTTAQHDLDVCVSSEQAAREQIIKDWATYLSAEKRQCVQPSVYLPSYVEWLTCLEMERSVRKPDAASQSPDAASPMTPPAVQRSSASAARGKRP